MKAVLKLLSVQTSGNLLSDIMCVAQWYSTQVPDTQTGKHKLFLHYI